MVTMLLLQLPSGPVTLTERGLFSVEWWETAINRVGLPLVLLALAAYLAWRIGRWLQPRLDRLLDSHLEFINKLDERMDVMGERISHLAEVQGESNRKLSELVEELRAERKSK